MSSPAEFCVRVPSQFVPTTTKGFTSLSSTWFQPRSWLTAFARSSILSALPDAVTVGKLTVVDAGGSHAYGQRKKGCNDVHLIVVNDEFWLRLMISGSLGFSEAYMMGDVEVSDLTAVMNLWIDNQSGMELALSSIAVKISTRLSGLYNNILGQSRSQARLNAVSAYDQSNQFFMAFLSKEMMYSCALWDAAEGGVRGDLESGPSGGDLEIAQRRKLHHVLRKARVKPGHRVLEFGTGWGGCALEAARAFGCEVDTLTLSAEQKQLAEARIKEAGLQDRVRVHLLDYRDIPPAFEKAFDAFVSIEMLEHVGPNYHSRYFKLVDFALKSAEATVTVTTTTRPESRYSSYQDEDFGRRYMYPNVCVPSATALVVAAQDGSQGRLTLESIENHTAHYPRTLREWGRRFEASVTQDLVSKDYPGLRDPAAYEAFRRKWRYFFAYAAAGYAKGYTTSHMLTFVRPNDPLSEKCD